MEQKVWMENYRNLVKTHKKTFVIAGVVGIISGATLLTVYADIPVIDNSNLDKTITILEKTQKLVDSAQQQLNIQRLMSKNINTFMDTYNKYVTKHINDLNTTLSKAGGYISQAEGVVNKTTGKIESYTSEKYLLSKIPEITVAQKDGKIVINPDAPKIAYAQAQGSIIANNQKILDAQKEINEQLTECRKELTELIEKNAALGESDGILAAQQLNNQIKALDTYMNSLLVEQKALEAQATALRDQAEAQRIQNEMIQREAMDNAAKAEREEAEKFYSTYTYVRELPWQAILDK